MKEKIYDSIVIGLGAMGSSSLYHLARSGARVLGIEQFSTPHKYGSTHGDSRVTRQAYIEGKYYVDFAIKSYKIIEELEKISSQKLFQKTGGLYIGTKESSFIQGAIEAANEYNLPYSILTKNEIEEKFKFFSLKRHSKSNNLHGFYENNAGILFPEKILNTQLSLSKEMRNCEIINNTEIRRIVQNTSDKTYTLYDQNNKNYESRSIVLSAGPWIIDLLKKIEMRNKFKLDLKFEIEKNQMMYFKFKKHRYQEELKKIFPLYFFGDLENHIYGFPDFNSKGSFKICTHYSGESYNNIKEVNRDLNTKNIEKLVSISKDFISEFSNENIDYKIDSCIYTNTPKKEFLIDFFPDTDDFLILSPCSGHGFKFSPRIGDFATNLIQKKEKIFELFSLANFNI